MVFEGTYTALVTPFRRGEVDFGAFKTLLERQKAGGVAGVVPCGCTGEAATLSLDERKELLRLSLETIGGSLRVVPGTGTNATQSTIALTKEAERAGAPAALIITPYYNKPSQRGLVEHYLRVAEATTIPLVLYNVPGRTGVTLSAETVAELHASGRFAAIKEAAGSVDAVSDLRAKCGITVLSGDDSLTLPMMAVGAMGVVSVVSNLVPSLVREMVENALAGEYGAARQIHYRLLPVVRAAFVESNPSPIKAMLSLAGFVENELRAPLVPVGEKSLAVVRRALEGLGAEVEGRRP
ncbi:MAG: dapA [Candidatus Krumholzibacteriota bacterium]|nr:dapA [Candidatus Krumholzibacteriota bacterium]